ncbi:uncharacterized protein FTOL_13329 [Fusarium torulosum]|uniref:Uncharacterized protein n=1 Tax=Fusarium torulosum TaxID=33205 RepID=A0AAE8MP59_9HYPO|nr:uncharacterized protein FTOL_13329 [Fusarium torulosum]
MGVTKRVSRARPCM